MTTLDGRRVQYDDIWQRRNLVLVIVSPQERDEGARYASQLRPPNAQASHAPWHVSSR